MTTESYESKQKEAESWIIAKLEPLLATVTKLLISKQQFSTISVLVNARSRVTLADWFWDQGIEYFSWQICFSLPAIVYGALENPQAIETEIDAALANVMRSLSDNHLMRSRIQTEIEEDQDWRHKARQFLAGEGITNQGRIRSDNIAARQHDGLLFRSKQEVLFYTALKRAGITFAPLPVFLRGGLKYTRKEPDFVILKDGIIMIVEVDGDLYHSETPAEAHARLKFLTDEGAKIERIPASSCDTPEKARGAAELIIATIEKSRRMN